jgi:hypothetical protein
MFLSLRHDAEDGFACFPVCFSDRDELEQAMSVLEVLHDPDSGQMASWGVVNFTAIQFAQGDSVEEVAGRVVQSLRDRDDLNRQDSSADRLAGQLAEHLVGGSPQIIDELAEKLRKNAPYLVSNNRTALAALAIVQEVLDTGELFAARTMLGELGTAFSQSKRQCIISELLPLQLRADSAALFLRRRAGGGLTHTGLFCDYPDFTVRTYLRRAYLTRVPPTLITLNSIHGSYEEFRGALRAAWRQGRKKSPLGPLTPEQVDRQLANLQRDVYVSLPGPVDEGVLAQLDAAYPRIAFVVHHASDGADLPLPQQLLPILPNLAGDEIRIIEDFEAADEDWEGQGSWQR